MVAKLASESGLGARDEGNRMTASQSSKRGVRGARFIRARGRVTRCVGAGGMRAAIVFSLIGLSLRGLSLKGLR
jgi:hypothetical protein